MKATSRSRKLLGIGLAAAVAVTTLASAPVQAIVNASVSIERSVVEERHIQQIIEENIGGSLYRTYGHGHWSRNCPPPSSLDVNDGAGFGMDGEPAACCCSITDHGAIGDNSTVNTIAIQSTIDACHETCFLESALSRILHDGVRPIPNEEQEPSLQALQPQPQRVVVYVPKGMFRTGSLKLRSNTRFHIGKGASIYGSDNPKDYPVVSMVPDGYETHKRAMFRSLFSGFNVENVSITGENYGYPPGSFARYSSSPAGSATMNGSWNDTAMSVIDGVGWKWWCKFRSMPIPQSYCEKFNPNNKTMPDWIFRPKLIEFYNSTNIVLDRFTARNSPCWNIHTFLSKNIVMTNLTVLSPREVGNTDGLDPDSSENVLMDSCYIDVGDDGVSIKSSNHSGIMAPTRNVTMRNLRIVSRNWCIGSATFGGVYDILFEDSTIGDLDTVTSPWAIKFKSHRYYPGPMENITIRRIEMGQIGPTPWMYPKHPGSVFLLGLSYGQKNHDPGNKRSGKPLFRNVTFEDISVASAGVAGQIRGVPEDCLEGLTLKNISVRGGTAHWTCENVDLDSLTVENVHPPVSCKGGCSSDNTAMDLFSGELFWLKWW